jgi:acetyl esterase/lipase
MPSTIFKAEMVFVKHCGHKRVFAMPVDALQKWFETHAAKRKRDMPSFLRSRFKVKEQLISDYPCTIIEPKAGAKTDAPRVLFLHGGGFIFEAVIPHWLAATKIVAKTGAELWFASYPLLPDATAYQAHQVVMAIWQKFCEQRPPGDISVIGDSAGAALALMLSHRLAAEQSAQPRQLILVSPGQSLVDDTNIVQQMLAIASKDVMLSMSLLDSINQLMPEQEGYARYIMRPLEGDFTNFPPTAVFSATYEILFPQAVKLAEDLLAAGVLREFMIGEEMCHVWPYAPSKEGRAALNKIFELINEQPNSHPDLTD